MTSVAQMPLVFLFCLAVVTQARLGHRSSSLSRESHVSKELTEQKLRYELGATGQRLLQWESALRPIFAALPKDGSGRLAHGTVRYALHRVFVQRYAWHIRGLEPSVKDKMSGVPSYIQGMVEQQTRRAGQNGLGLHEVAVLAATLEDLVHGEEVERLSLAYAAHSAPTVQGHDVGKEQFENLLATYMLFFAVPNHGNYSNMQLHQVEAAIRNAFAPWGAYHDLYLWAKDVQQAFDHIERTRTSPFKLGTTDFSAASQVVQKIGEQFGRFQSQQCYSMKDALLAIEDRDSGRVPLARFHGQGIASVWEFSESREYLRHLGALDETDPQKPSVIIPNYLTAHSNCILASELYSVCCNDECEALMAHLEGKIGGPVADVQRIGELVAALPSDTVSAPRNLSETLLRRLGEIATHHSGQIPLHGRLFAQWMHHAYPRECPYPHTSGVAGPPRTPDEWMLNEGNGSMALATQEELRLARSQADNSTFPDFDAEMIELPWSMEEELVVAWRPSTVNRWWSRSAALFVLLVLLICKASKLLWSKNASSELPLWLGSAATLQKNQQSCCSSLKLSGPSQSFSDGHRSFTSFEDKGFCRRPSGVLLGHVTPNVGSGKAHLC